MTRADVLFEVSWEVANMVGGIHTAIASKVPSMLAQYGQRYITIGPDMHRTIEGPAPFEEDNWDPSLRESLSELEIAVRMGRWKVPGNPCCLLVNYGALHHKKDEILYNYWEKYRLNSIFGSWDYFDPLLFAHGVGMVIEHYYTKFLLPERKQVVVQCHEWMAASTILYLEQVVPEVGTLFITHATVLGRALAANNRWDVLYDSKLPIDAEQLARENHVGAKHSMEYVTARAADSFATVSEPTALECERFLQKKPDFVLLHGSSEQFPDPDLAKPEAVKAARARLLEIASATTGDTYDSDKTTILISASRYEFVNKGIDVYIEALGLLANHLQSNPGHRVVAFGIFPSGHTGPTREIWTLRDAAALPKVSTHDLRQEPSDPILRGLRDFGIGNAPGAPVHMIFIPTYLDGNDPAIRDSYYSLLAGADLGVWPAIYEPWGYAPLESIALGVPAVTSDAGGFGSWVRAFGGFSQTGVCVLERQGKPSKVAAAQLFERVLEFVKLTPEARVSLGKAAKKTAARTRWEHFIDAHLRAETDAASKGHERESEITPERFINLAKQRIVTSSARGDVTAHMREFTVINAIPAELVPLRKLAANLAWAWDLSARSLFERIHPELWAAVGYNPAALLDRVPQARLQQLAKSPEYVADLNRTFQELAPTTTIEQPEIAYFCMEFGLVGFLKIYSGGLGILAGDHLKSASDLSIPLCAVGLAYNAGYFRQVINREGQQNAEADRTDFYSEPFEPVLDQDGTPLLVSVLFPNGYVQLRAWCVRVGRIKLFLLDTNVEANRPEERAITSSLYGGDLHMRLRQELILSLGGVELIRKLKMSPRIFHMNEGHSAFLILARMRYLMQEQGLKYLEAWEYVRHTTVFTTHTPVEAGHDVFPEAMVRPYLAPYMDVLQLDWDAIYGLGQNPDHPGSGFGTTQLALRGSVRANGVSEIHGEVTRRMFRNLHPGLHPDEIPITSVTNGVHVPTWAAPEWQQVFSRTVGKDWREHLTDKDRWDAIHKVDPALAWSTHQHLKQRLIQFLKQHLRVADARRRRNPSQLARTLEALNENTLLIVFARRFAPYKRADLIFQDLPRLERILNGNKKALLVFAGKAHPADHPGQDLIRRIFDVTRRPEFSGRVLLVENYDIDVSKGLVSGADIWLNTPTRPLEASGTSGMKAAINGCLNLSIDDGWWPEGYDGKNGWIVRRDAHVPDDSQNEHDSSEIYELLESTVIPSYYDRDSSGVPLGWVEMMKHSIASLVPRFSATRMLGEYMSRLYGPAIEDSKALQANGFERLHELNRLKKRLIDNWNSITFINARIDGLDHEQIELGRPLHVRVELSHPELSARDLETHVVIAHGVRGELERFETHEMKPVDVDQFGESAWRYDLECSVSGPHAVGIRVVPRHSHPDSEVDLALELVRWL